MKTLYINAGILDNKPSGLGIYSKNILEHLGSFCKNTDNKVFSNSNEEFKNIEKLSTPKNIAPSNGKFAGLSRFLWTQGILPFKCKSKQDIVYCPTQYATFLMKNKQIITVHDLIPLKFPKQNKPQYIYYKYILPILLKKCEVITISENSKNDLVEYFGINEQKINVIYNGYDETKFNLEIKDKNYIKEKFNLDKFILIVGASYPHKNIDNYLKAYSKIKDKIDEKVVIVGGRKEYKEYLKCIVKELNLEEKVIFMPYLTDEEIVLLYQLATVLAYPTYYEGFGLPPVEAMACGTAVVMSDTSSLPEIGGDAAIYFNPYNIDDMSEKTLLILKNNELREDLIKKGLENIKRFSWINASKEIAEIINRL